MTWIEQNARRMRLLSTHISATSKLLKMFAKKRRSESSERRKHLNVAPTYAISRSSFTILPKTEPVWYERTITLYVLLNESLRPEIINYLCIFTNVVDEPQR